MTCRELPKSHIFGVPSKHESGSVSTLLKGDYSPEQLQDDADLGKSVKEGWRNLGPAGRVSVPSFSAWLTCRPAWAALRPGGSCSAAQKQRLFFVFCFLVLLATHTCHRLLHEVPCWFHLLLHNCHAGKVGVPLSSSWVLPGWVSPCLLHGCCQGGCPPVFMDAGLWTSYMLQCILHAYHAGMAHVPPPPA